MRSGFFAIFSFPLQKCGHVPTWRYVQATTAAQLPLVVSASSCGFPELAAAAGPRLQWTRPEQWTVGLSVAVLPLSRVHQPHLARDALPTDGSCPRSALRPRARDSSACASPVLPLIFFSDSRQKCMQRARTSLINSQNMPTSVLNSPVGGTDSSVFVPVHASSSCPEPASAALLSPLSLSATNNTPRMQGAQQFGSMLTNSGSLGLYGTPMYTRYIHCKHLSRVGIHRRFVYR